MDASLLAFSRVDFDWTSHVDSIWTPPTLDVCELQREAREEIDRYLDDFRASRSEQSPLGIPLIGAAGAGKTHLLSVLRQRAIENRMFFVLVDMTDVGDFWATVLLGYLRSLQQPGYEPNRRQLDTWFAGLVDRYGASVSAKARGIPAQRPPRLSNTCNDLIAVLRQQFPERIREHADVIRALFLFSCDHAEINDLGYKWLQGIGIDADEKEHHGFGEAQRRPLDIVRGLSWLLSLCGPTILALDQLDAIVAERNTLASDEAVSSEQARASLAIIQGISGGLLALRDVTRKTLSVVSALHATWDILKSRTVASMPDRYREPLFLDAAHGEGALRHLVLARLERGYGEAGFKPEYPSYPFKGEFFQHYAASTPRELLKACDSHRRFCRKKGAVEEIGKQRPPPAARPQASAYEHILERKKELEAAAPLAKMLGDETERCLDELIEAACRALVREHALPPSVLPQIDLDFVGTGSYDPLHARIRLILTHEGERERHYAFRFLQQNHHRAFQSRLKAAITASGIDHAIGFRRLAILRTDAPPGGAATRDLVEDLVSRGGRLMAPAETELRTLYAISQLLDGPDAPDQVDTWLRQDQPVSKLPSFQDAADWLFKGYAGVVSDAPPPVPVARETAKSDVSRAVSQPQVAGATQELPLGRVVSAGSVGEAVSIPLSQLASHTCVLAGSGSGKTVFLRRIVEEAVLLGVPSIVLDGANDLSRLGELWPSRPSAFSVEDEAQAQRYHAQSEVIVWTPGIGSGNPMSLAPIPDFRAIEGDSDEARDQFEAAVQMTLGSLGPALAPGKSARATKLKGILSASIRYFGNRGGHTLHGLIDVLREPPDEVIEAYADGAKLAQQLAEVLHSTIQSEPLLNGAGCSVTPSDLLRAADPNRVRVSVINLAGLRGPEAQQQFVNQLAMALFAHIKRNPAKPETLLGLFVLDEAKDFIPSTKSGACKDSIIRLAAQARKYGLGMLFATQAPKSIDHNVVANCSTLLVGKANSPTAIETVGRLLQDKGGNSTQVGKEVGKLPTGTFFISTPKHSRPIKLRSSLCLSHHPSSPPDERQVVEIARRSKVQLERKTV